MTQAVETLSGGQRQCVAVARAAAFAHHVVILDEPTAALGVKEGNMVLDLIRQTVESAGGRMEDVFKLVQYFRNLDHFPLYSTVRRQFFPEVSPASTVVEVSGLMPTADVLIEVEATAWIR